jgi:hypothetical protein
MQDPHDARPRVVSLGVDCSVALWKRQRGVAEETGPLDWGTAFRGYDAAFAAGRAPVVVDAGRHAAALGLTFPHAPDAATAAAQFERRFARLEAWLTGSGGRPVLLVRKGHTQQSHLQANFAAPDEVAAARAVAAHLDARFPGARFHVHLLLACDSCDAELRAPTPTPVLDAPRLTVRSVVGCATGNHGVEPDGTRWRGYEDVVAAYCDALLAAESPRA